MKNTLVFWVERYLYNPNFLQKLLSYTLLPLSWLYCFVHYLRYLSMKPEDMGVKVVGVGNLNVGGSGKTPLITAMASEFEDVAMVLRGYGRKTQGLYVVKDKDAIQCDVVCSGDEAMIYAQKLPNAIVIVSEDRKEGIRKAKALGAKVVFLDDAYSKHNIAKLDIVIEIESQNKFCLPSGAYREKLWNSKEVLLVKEGRDFYRETKIVDEKEKLSLVTAIARPERLESFLPEVVSKNYFADHYHFEKEELEEILKRDGSDALLVTYKDFVKIESYELPLALLDLDMKVDEKILQSVRDYCA